MEGEQKIIAAVREDEWMMDILAAAKTLELPDWWICAGFLRSKMWDELHRYEYRTPLSDIDVIYFDAEKQEETDEKRYESILADILPKVPWSVKNQARMHRRNQLSPYESAVDAISKFPETATAVGIKLSPDNHLIVAAPCGTEDLLTLQVKPTQHFIQHLELLPIYQKRLADKSWQTHWPKLSLYR